MFLQAVEAGPATVTWQTEGFATAALRDESGRFRGLAAGERPTAVDATTWLVRPEVALEQLEADREAGGDTSPAGGDGEEAAGTDEHDGGGTSTPATRFRGSIRLDPSRPSRDFGKIMEEVLQHLSTLAGTDVEITVDIEARREEGFPDPTVRTVTENATTLKFEPGAGFE